MKKLAPERRHELFSPESVELFRPKLDEKGKQIYKTVTVKGKKVRVKVREKYIVHEENSIQVARRTLGFGETQIQTRCCLGCSEKFESEGKHNRMCIECANYRGMI